jgi:ATP-dependent helicase HepA
VQSPPLTSVTTEPFASVTISGKMAGLMTRVFVPGQRWLSETEPELGLGMVLTSTPHQVTVVFRATGTTRQYSIESAPLKRVVFRVGETVKGEGDAEIKVTEVLEQNGLVVYRSNGTELPETLVSDQMNFNTPRERLLSGHVSESAVFDLRAQALQLWHEARKSPARGFVGGRIGLIPHQLYIASEVTNRFNPRVLLADEVGLGKTIESCLILHRLMLTGRVQRVLILVPESLVHQWFIELLRRFNLWFSIFDEERCASIEQNDPEANPFRDDQLIIASLEMLAQKETRVLQATDAEWDLLIIDEAHHLRWSAEAPSTEYRIVEALAKRAPAVLLLTATPEQLGAASHFARLRLLDPERFHNLDQYLEEQKHYEEFARIAERILSGQPLSPEEAAKAGGPASNRDELLKRLLDQHGTGRVMFRNTRAAMTNFPQRIAKLVTLEIPGSRRRKEADSGSSNECPTTTASPGRARRSARAAELPEGQGAAPPPPPAGGYEELIELLHAEFETDADPYLPKPDYDFDEDPRIDWLAKFLREDPARKVLLLCRYREKVEMIEGALQGKIKVNAAVFHEKLPLVQRDRNAAWFAEEEGAQILICSEIGSEGRNFQFAHHLVLFDLPHDPELLEQRIGRLDRIGQSEDIKIHIPFVSGSPQEALARWYHEGMTAFEHHFTGGAELGERFGPRLFEIALEEDFSRDFAQLLQETKAFRQELDARLHSGRDRLLELQSFNAAQAAQVVQAITTADADSRLDAFVTAAFDHFGLNVDELGNRTFNLGGGDLFHEKIPALPEEGLTATADRARALSRENVGFLTWDHPIMTSLLDMLLGSEQGNTAFALWPNAPEGGVIIETLYVVEAQAPPALHLDRFLPPTPLRIVLNHKRKELGPEAAPEILRAALKNGDPAVLSAQLEEFGNLLPGMLRVTEIIAGKQSKPIIEAAAVKAGEMLQAEITRLEQLRAINPSVRSDEIEAARKHSTEVQEHLAKAVVRLDSARLIIASTKGR